jgi:hypothetical protein
LNHCHIFKIAEAHQSYICKGCSYCIDPNLASIMAIGLLILPNKLLVLNTISISLQVSLFFTLQKHNRHIFAKVIHIALILIMHPPWRSVLNMSCAKNIIHTALSVTFMYSALCGLLKFKLIFSRCFNIYSKR